MNHRSDRLKRINGLLYRETVAVLSRMRDPKLQGVLVTAVECSDMRFARVRYIFELDALSCERPDVWWQRLAKKLRAELFRSTDLKMIPELTFCYDNTAERSRHIESLLKEADDT